MPSSAARLLATLALLFLSAIASFAQLLNQRPEPRPPHMSQPARQPEPTPTFRSSSRLVVVDVVAADHDGNPVSGLSKNDFTILEDGKPQELRVFEPHVPARQLTKVPELPLGPNEFTNFPKQAVNSAVNVVLFDILNTPTEDQLYARQQMVDFLKTLPPGERVALFTLGYDLKMVAGFTTSTDELIAAAMKVKPGVSALLDTEHDQAMENHAQAVLNANTSGHPVPGGGAGAPLNMETAMHDFIAENRLVRLDMRTEKTFDALGRLARSMAGYTGRKNLLWLSEAFPAGVLPERDARHVDTRNYLAIFQKYSGLMEASQISVYPIDIRGLRTSTQDVTGSPDLVSQDKNRANLGSSHLLMRDVAEQTGGQYFINRNDLKGAMRRSIEHGSTYYTLAYSPSNRKMDGSFRRIEVKVARDQTRLDYRRGYYAVADDPTPADTARRMLIAEMQPGVPESTMLLLRVRVVAADPATGKVNIDYGVYAGDLVFSGDDVKHGKLEFVAVAWDQNNKAAGDVSQTMELDLKPETFQRILNTGVPAHQELTLKPGKYHLRLGVMDYSSSRIGTLEIPLTIEEQQHASK